MADSSDRVRNQYEALPYPPRDPAEERVRLLPTSADHLDQVNTHCFGGRRRFDATFRVLVAGGGTGDATVFLAEQLRGTGAQVVHVDLSEASITVARERVRVRELDGVEFVQQSLLELTPDVIGTFDYINCSGVLHHLDDPDAGLRSLRSLLRDGGAMAIMLYGRYGRTGVYQMQELLRQVTPAAAPLEVRLDHCKRLLTTLPASNWFRRQQDELLDLHIGDAGIVDLLLHPCDRAYSVPEVYAFVRQAGLELLTFIKLHGAGRQDYLPRRYLRDRVLLEQIEAQPIEQQHAIAELLSGDEIKHTFYCAAARVEAPSPTDEQLVPHFSLHFDVRGQRHTELVTMFEAAAGRPSRVEHAGRRVSVRLNDGGLACLRAVDGHRTIAEVLATARCELSARGVERDGDGLLRDWQGLFAAMSAFDWMLLRGSDVPACRRLEQIQLELVRRLKDSSTTRR